VRTTFTISTVLAFALLGSSCGKRTEDANSSGNKQPAASGTCKFYDGSTISVGSGKCYNHQYYSCMSTDNLVHDAAHDNECT
jgi:hypothetical protein